MDELVLLPDIQKTVNLARTLGAPDAMTLADVRQLMCDLYISAHENAAVMGEYYEELCELRRRWKGRHYEEGN